MTANPLSSRRLLERLVAFDTVTQRPNLELIEFIERLVADLGIETHRVPGVDPDKANLLARTTGSHRRGGLLFAGHADVVPTEGQAWTTDPFDLVERDGRLYGRGTADMKGFLAAVLSRLPDLAAGPVPITVALTDDEEVSCLGVRQVLRFMEERNVPRPELCIVGEPTGLVPVTAHKSKQSFRVEVTGRECHSALAPQGVNAVEIAAELVTWLRARAHAFATQGPFDVDFDPPHTTLQTGIMHGGTAVNIVPNHCRFDFELRCLPSNDADTLLRGLRALAENGLLPEMRAKHPEADITITTTSDYAPLAAREETRFTALVEEITGARASCVSFATEAGFYQRAGIPTVVCGPGHITQAHRPDEFLEIAQLERCERFVDALVHRFASAVAIDRV